jgi:hypothetical protein
MTWFRVDDTLAAHQKVRRAGVPAMGLWVLAGSYCSQQLTDGFVPEWFVTGFPNGLKYANTLVTAGLWHEATVDGETGWLFHEWEQSNPTRAHVLAEREKAKKRQQSWRESRRDKSISHTVTDGVTDAVSNAAPTRPDPTQPLESPSDSLPVASLPDRFDDFWAVYPRRVGRGQAVKAWKTATKKADPDVIITAAASFAASRAGADEKFTPHPTTWLNREGWADERPPLRAVGDDWAPGARGSWDV